MDDFVSAKEMKRRTDANVDVMVKTTLGKIFEEIKFRSDEGYYIARLDCAHHATFFENNEIESRCETILSKKGYKVEFIAGSIRISWDSESDED